MKNELLVDKSVVRLRWLDVLKGIGIVLVVIGHISTTPLLVDWIYSFHMPLFFFAAGYVYKKRHIFDDLKRRFFTIIIPYFTLGGIVFIYWAIVERRFRDSSMGVIDSFIGLLRGQYDYLDFNVHLWFLPCFFLTVTLYNILMNIDKKLAYIVVSFLSLLYILCSLPQLPWGADWICKYVFFYMLGNILAEEKIVFRKWIIGVCLLAICFIIVKYLCVAENILWFITGSIGSIGIMQISSRIVGGIGSKLLEYFGRISIVVLCIHGPVYRVIVKIFSVFMHVSTDEIREQIIPIIIITAITLGVSSVVFEIIRKIAPWMIGKNKEYKGIS